LSSFKIDHLLGKEFDMEKQNCFTTFRDFFHDNFEIDIPDYACPTDWWGNGLDLYRTLASSEGFLPISRNPREFEPGDAIVMAIESTVGNHLGVILDNGKMLHHLVGQRSAVTNYGGMFRNTTVGVYRHEGVKGKIPESTVDIRTLLPPHVRRRLEDAETKKSLLD
jgi:cell wall-associated NlpC family hydrolase